VRPLFWPVSNYEKTLKTQSEIKRMARLSKQTKEIINIVLFFLAVGLVVTFYWIYPLGRAKVAMGRANLDEYMENIDSLSALPNSALKWEEGGFAPDTFSVDVDGLTTLACLRCVPSNKTGVEGTDSELGTVILLHGDGHQRDSLIDLAFSFLAAGYSVIACDQRASGRSTGEYRGAGWYEANDLSELLANTDLRYRLVHPVVAVGFGTGADAGMLVSNDEQRIDAVVAIEPYLSSTRWLNKLKEEHSMLWFPFFRSVIWWWYEMRSSYAPPYRESDDMAPVAVPTLLIMPQNDFDDEEVQQIQALTSNGELLELKPIPASDSTLQNLILDFVKGFPADSVSLEN
jgi:pimeloyl-ACP methyl ester carboxylesterase